VGAKSLNLLGGDTGGSMTENAHGGNDTISVTQPSIFGSAELAGDAIGSMSGNARGGNDHLTYTMGSDAQVGSGLLAGDAAGTMTDNARGGNDVLTVVVNGDPATVTLTLVGDAPTMSGSAHGGNDVLNGSARGDALYGDALSYFPAAPGSITGGRDILNGGGGNDQLWGGPNNDKFVFNTGSGMDVIHDFDQGNLAVGSTAHEHDVINVRDYGFANWAALSSLISDDSSGNAVVHLTANDTITLNGVHTAALHAADFII
jgi:Ca2+-binding RTX toxin-like protein